MNMRWAVAVTMDMAVARQHRRSVARRRIEWIVAPVVVIIVAMAMAAVTMAVMAMRMFDECCLVRMDVAVMVDGDGDVETVRLRNFVDRLPVAATIGEGENLTRAGIA